MINRVFKVDGRRESFPYYGEWIKEKKKMRKKSFDFDLFEEWIEGEQTERLAGSIEAMNKIFYRKE